MAGITQAAHIDVLIPLLKDLEASPRVCGIIQAIVQRKEEIESYQHGAIEASYTETSIRLRVIPPSRRFSLPGKD